ncbi:DUF2061 domain-containing protein [Deefgea rivuli]|nr:DUF2061 domain-containing protein [Deefgea rivuli]
MLKTITFAIVHFSVAFSVAYFFHEKAWDAYRAAQQQATNLLHLN